MKKINLNRAFTILFIFLSTSIVTSAQEYKVIGYYPDWTKWTLPANKIEFEKITHLIHCFGWPTAEGDLKLYDDMIYPELNNRTHAAGKKILLALGGADSANFATMAADDQIREKFLNNVVQFIQTYNYDGIDWDWEFPKDSDEGKLYVTLIKELREKFNQISDSLIISMATSSGNWVGQRIRYEDMVPYLDWFGLMGYDYHGGWTDHSGHNAPLYSPVGEPEGSEHLSVKYLRETRSIPEDKIIFGVPFYGKEFESEDIYKPQTGDVTIFYSDAVNKINAGWEYIFDDVAKVPYLRNNDHSKIVTYEDTVSLGYKTQYVKDNNLAGIMIWELSQGMFNDEQPLLDKVYRGLKNPPTNINDLENSVVNKFELLNNYPNPFNPTTIISYKLKTASMVQLQVYDLLGRLVTNLVSEYQSAGSYSVNFDANSVNAQLTSGMYLYVLRAAAFVQSKKMMLIK